MTEKLKIDLQVAWLDAIIESLPVGIFLADETGKIIMTNKIAEKIWGGTLPVNQDSPVYKEYQGWWPETGEPVKGEEWALARALSKGERSESEVINILRFDGRPATILNSASPVLKGDKKIAGGVVIIKDISRQHKLYSFLNRALDNISTLEFLDEALELVTTDPMFETGCIYLVEDEELRISTSSGLDSVTLENLKVIPFGKAECLSSFKKGKVLITVRDEQTVACVPMVKSDEVLGMLCVGLMEEQQLTKVDEEFLVAIANTMASFIARKRIEANYLLTQNLLESMVEVRTAKLTSLNQKLREEILERKIIEKSLRASEERFFKAFNGSPIIKCISTTKDNVIVDVNESFIKIIGYNRADIVGKSFSDLITLKEAEEDYKINDICRVKHKIDNIGVNFRTKDNVLRQGLLSLQLIEMDQETFILTCINDITDYHNVKEKMVQLDRLNLIGEMAAGISHEVRNPMTTVRGFLQLLSLNKDLVQHKDRFDLMIEELDRANSIISEFLSLGRSEPGNLSVENLNRIIELLFPLIQADAFRQGQDVKLNLQEVPDFPLNGKEIRQVILNLVRNGIEASTDGAELLISTYSESNKVYLVIKDEGNGIDKKLIKKLGTPFLTTKLNGTGLGLPICYSIVKRHKGEIQVESGDKGTTFKIIFTLS